MFSGNFRECSGRVTCYEIVWKFPEKIWTSYGHASLFIFLNAGFCLRKPLTAFYWKNIGFLTRCFDEMSRSVWKTSRNVSVKFPYWFGTKIQKCSVTCPISISVGWGMPRHRPFLSASAGACPGILELSCVCNPSRLKMVGAPHVLLILCASACAHHGCPWNKTMEAAQVACGDLQKYTPTASHQSLWKMWMCGVRIEIQFMVEEVAAGPRPAWVAPDSSSWVSNILDENYRTLRTTTKKTIEKR